MDGTEKPVVLKILKDAKVSIENGDCNDILFKSNFCRCTNEKVATKTILRLLMQQPVHIKRKHLTNLVTQITKKPREECVEMDTVSEEIYEEDEEVDLNNFVVDTNNIPGDQYYNDIVLGRKYINFSDISEDKYDSDFFICTICDKFINVRIPKCVLLALYQYKACRELSDYRLV
jgi:hypothetical protein